MPKLKQPIALEDLVMLRVIKMIQDACESWIRTLREAAKTGSEAYLKETENVRADCDKLHDLIASLPLAPTVITMILEFVAMYDESCSVLKDASGYEEEEHNNLCAKMFRVVLFACTRAYETKFISSSFAQKLIIQTLDCVPNLIILAFNTKTEMDYSALLASNIHHLTKLQSFEYHYHCTDDVVEQLGLHCSKLRTVILSYSEAVTDVSVQHLMKLRDLEHVNLVITSITCELYGTLLSELPRIDVIMLMLPEYDSLAHITKENLYTITQYIGYI
jgi:hypothetical protein